MTLDDEDSAEVEVSDEDEGCSRPDGTSTRRSAVELWISVGPAALVFVLVPAANANANARALLVEFLGEVTSNEDRFPASGDAVADGPAAVPPGGVLRGLVAIPV
jgi:hypothetical protein